MHLTMVELTRNSLYHKITRLMGVESDPTFRVQCIIQIWVQILLTNANPL